MSFTLRPRPQMGDQEGIQERIAVLKRETWHLEQVLTNPADMGQDSESVNMAARLRAAIVKQDLERNRAEIDTLVARARDLGLSLPDEATLPTPGGGATAAGPSTSAAARSTSNASRAVSGLVAPSAAAASRGAEMARARQPRMALPPVFSSAPGLSEMLGPVGRLWARSSSAYRMVLPRRTTMVALGLLVTISGVGVAARLSDMEVLGGPVRAAVVRLASPQVPSQGTVGELAPEDGVPSSGDAESSLIVSPDSDGVMAEGSDVAGLEAPSLIDAATEELEAEDPEVEAVEESEKAASSQGGWLERSRSLWAKLRAPGFSGVNLRLAPSLSAAISKVLPVGAQVELMAKRAVAGGLAWRQVRTQGGEVGWVAEGAVDEE